MMTTIDKKTPTAQFINVKISELSAGARGYEFVFLKPPLPV
jgi:hypothetical protein